MPAQHRKVMQNIIDCRTEKLGGEVFLCEKCHEFRFSFHSCQDRHCTKCGNDKVGKWLKKQTAFLLPAPYFFITFTLPHELAAVAYRNQRYFCHVFFHACAEAMKKLARDPKFVGGQIGFFGVLHTWKRNLGYHPHIHFIVAGGGLSKDGTVWCPSYEKYFLSIDALKQIYRAKVRDALKKKPKLFATVPPETWKKNWGIHCKAVGNGEHALKYLAPYIFRVAISNSRLKKLEHDNVTFEYRDRKTHELKTRMLPAVEFIGEFMQHVLPHGLVKVRYYGLFSPGNRKNLEKVRKLLGATLVEEASNPRPNPDLSDDARKPHVMYCPKCRALLTWIETKAPIRSRGP